MSDRHNADEIWFLSSRVTVAMPKAENSERISLLVHHTPFGDAPPLHIHYGEDEIFYVLDGEIQFEVDGKTMTLRPGQAVCAPRDVPHRYRVVSPNGARYLTVTRGGFEDMVRSVSRPAENAGLPPHEAPSEEKKLQLATACFAHGINLIGPPLAA
ncbi:cupin domain-containing protein [Rhizobium sp. LjRoot30]|uniref:cupin domain-containing protein n=1 Tax=Rhizobium sp. LjRoot30 TaxID=3342320 RepID=UPI003ECEA595